MKQAIILAGGKGTRLRERLGGLPKPLVDVCGTPLLERQILLAKKHGFTEILILVNHAAEFIVDYCREKNNWGLSIQCIDDGEPRGTAGATLAVFDRLADEFLVMYGDTMLEVDLTRFHEFHASSPTAVATLFLHPNDHPHDSDLVELTEDCRVTAFHPYPHDSARYYPNLVNAALYWIKKSSLNDWRDKEGMLDFGKHLFPAMLQQRLVLRGYNSFEYIKDIGTPTRLDKVCADLRSGKIARASLEQSQAMIFIDRDGTINREVDHLSKPEQFELLPGVVDAIKRLNRSDYRSCVITNQPVIARGDCSVEELQQIHNKMETLLGQEGAYLDRIYYCPHHPHGGFPGERPELKVACDCRKPMPGMVERALREFNGDRNRSWLVGDTSVDIETARRAGLKSILVESGYAGLDYREWAVPDVIVPDLSAATSFILDHYPRLLAHCSQLATPIADGAIVLIGGLSRSGKSTLAAVMRDAIEARGGSAKILSLDRWLHSEDRRAQGVLGRYDLSTVQTIVDMLADCGQRQAVLKLPGYHKLEKRQIEEVGEISLAATDVILLEGTVALALETPAGIYAHRFHVDIAEEVRRVRVLREYRLRGYTDREAVEIYQARQQDEVPVIESLSRAALRISLENLIHDH